jgi:hypothetical protein
MFAKTKVAVLSLALLPVLAPASRADGFGITLMNKFHNVAVSLGFSSGSPAIGTCEPRPAPVCWVPGHYETVYRQVWVEGCLERVWVAPVYEWRSYGWGRPVRACVRGGRYEIVRGAGHYETRPFQVWVEGAWRPA